MWWYIKGMVFAYLLTAAYTDLKRRQVSVKEAVAFSILGAVAHIFDGEGQKIWITGILPGLFLLAAARASRQAVGYGDALALLVVGVYLGFWPGMQVLTAGLFLSCPVSLYYLVWKKAGRKKTLPFIPFLFLGYLLWLLCFGWNYNGV